MTTASKTLQQEAQLPKLEGVQFDPDSSLVNLFRGSSSFPVQLLNLPGRNGLDYGLSLFYQSDVATPRVDQWSLDKTQDIAGVGWSLPYEQIVVASKLNGTLEDNQYFWIMNGQPVPLYPIQRYWDKGILDSSYQADLANPTVNAHLQEGFVNQQISISTNAEIISLGGAPASWRIEDPDNEKIYTITTKTDGSGSFLIQTGGISFELYNYQYWRISYYPLYESWEIVKNDGNTYIFGGLGESIDGEEPNTQQYGVKWGNWIGPSTQTVGQERYTKAWNLAKVQNPLNNYYVINYLTDTQPVGAPGGLEYTKNCVVSKVKNDLGWTVSYNYEDAIYDNSSLESPKEYLDPHTDPSILPGGANAYQSSYLTKYLSELVVRNAHDEVQTYIKLGYVNFGTENDPNYLWNPNSSLSPDASDQEKLAYGATYDRYLGSITQYAGQSYGYSSDVLDRYSSPGVSFNYDFDPNPSNEKPRGLLTEIINPTGGKTLFTYKKEEAGTSSYDERSLTVWSPSILNGKYQPRAVRTWSGQDYVVCCWYDSVNNKLRVNVYTWVGWWENAFPTELVFDNVSIDLDKLQVIPSANTFLLVIPAPSINKNTHIYRFNRVKLQNAQWSCSNIESPAIYEGNQISASNGNDFFVVKSDSVVDTHTWNPLLQSWDSITRINIPSGITYYTAATENYYVLFKYNDLTQAGEFTYRGRDLLGNWTITKTLPVEIPIPHFGGFSYFQMSPSSSFVAISVVTGYVPNGSSGFESFNYDIDILTWDSNYNLQFIALDEIQNSSNGAFTNIPSSVLNGYPGIAPIPVNNSAIGTGPNYIYFDGVNWSCESLGISYEGFSDPDHQYYWYAYDEQGVIKTENTDSGILSVVGNRDPSNPSSGWLSQELLDVPGQIPTRYDQAYPTNAGQYITIGDQVYCKPLNSGGWDVLTGQDFLNITQSLNADESIDTTTFINSGDYVAFQILDENQNSKAVGIVYFKNGTFVVDGSGKLIIDRLEGQKVFNFFNTDHRYKSNINGKIPQIISGVITYPNNVSSLDSTSSITLNRYSAERFSGTIEGWTVQSITYDSGYDQSYECYSYMQRGASADGFKGTILRFYETKKYEGCLTPPEIGASPNGFEISCFYNGRPRSGEGYSIDSYGILDGQLWRKKLFDNNGQLVAATEMEFNVQTEIALSPDESDTTPLHGGIVQVSSVDSMQDGITTTMSNTYSLASGNVISSNSSYYNSMGNKTYVQDDVQFAYTIDDYIGLWYQNNLTLVAQNSKKVHQNNDPDVLASSQIQTYQLWETSEDPTVPKKWGSWKTYIATNATPTQPFAWWLSGEPDPTDGWIKSNDVISRNEQGAVVTYSDIEGISTTSIYDDSNTFTLATFANSTFADGISYTSFEYYQPDLWVQTIGIGGVIPEDSFIGKQCYQLDAIPEEASSSIEQTISIENADQYYCFNLWYKTLSNADASNIITLNITESGSSSPQTITLPLTQGVWTPFQWSVNLANLWPGGPIPSGPLNLTLEIKFTTSSAVSEYLRVDQIVFAPTLSPFAGTVLDIDKLRPIGNISADGMSGKVLYNAGNTQYTAIGPYDQTTVLGSSYSVKQDPSYDPNIPFPQDKPNLTISANGRDKGFYDLFMSSESLANYSVLEGNISNWSVVDNSLQINTDTLQLLKVNGYSAQNISVYLTNTPTFTSDHNNPQQKMCLGVASDTSRFYVQWDGDETSNQWQLLKWDGVSSYAVVSTNVEENWQPEWQLSIIEDRLFFTANGILVFNYQDVDLGVSAHTPILGVNNTANQQVSFQNLTALGDIQMDLSYSDGLGRSLQSLAVESSESVIMAPSVYDSLGRSTISLLPSRIESPGVSDPFAFDPNFITNGYRSSSTSIWDGHPVLGNINNYQSGGYPFSRVINEASPLKRPIKSGLPGEDFAITSENNPHVTAYSYGKNEADPGFLYGLPLNQYYVTTTIDPDGNKTVEYSTTTKQLVGTIKYNAAQTDPIKSSQVFDIYGQVIGSIPPNYYQDNQTPQTGDFEAEPSTTSYQYDFWGRQIQSSYPDSGVSKVIYDNVGRPRFSQDALGATGNTYYNYIKYDILGRDIEEGVYTDVGGNAWDPTELKNNANDSTYPSTNTTVSNTTLYDVDNITGDNSSNLTSLGRQWKSKTFNSKSDGTDTADIETTYTYNITGSPLSITQQATYDGVPDASYSMSYSYTITDRVQTVSDNVTSATTTYNVNMLEQVKEIEAASTSKSVKANYTYDQNGNIKNIELLQPDGSPLTTRNYEYLANNWLAGMSDSYVAQGLQYTEGSCDAATPGYYNGALAHNTVTYPGITPPSTPSDYCYTVDHLNRVITANNEGVENSSWTFDDNSNFITNVTGTTTRNYNTAPDKNQLESITNDPTFIRYYTYNAVGDLSQVADDTNPLMNFTYNNWNNKARDITKPQTSIESVFDYDSDDLRFRKRVYNNGTLESTVINTGALEITSSTTDQTIRDMGTSGVGLVYRHQDNGGTFYWILSDHLGSTRAIVDEIGNTQYSYNYDVYGVPTIVPVGTPDLIYNNLFTGQYYDSELELYNFHARFYDPIIARFLQTDPANQYYNPYSYVGGMPNMAIDPTGMMSGQSIAAIVLGSLAIVGSIAATIATAGGASPLIAGVTVAVHNVIIGTAIGAGATSIAQGALNPNDDVYESGGFWADLTLSGVFGAIGGLGGTVIASRIAGAYASIAADVAFNTASGAIDGYVSNGVINSINGDKFNTGAGAALGIGAAAGGLGSLVPAAFVRGSIFSSEVANRNFFKNNIYEIAESEKQLSFRVAPEGKDVIIGLRNGGEKTQKIIKKSGMAEYSPPSKGNLSIQKPINIKLTSEQYSGVERFFSNSNNNSGLTNFTHDVLKSAGFHVPWTLDTPKRFKKWFAELERMQKKHVLDKKNHQIFKSGKWWDVGNF